jgi:acetyltransferase-like isoleucine patch superfamily enzyme
MRVAREVGPGRVARFAWWSAYAALARATPTPLLRAGMLRLGGASIGPGTLVNPGLRLENLDRHRGLAALRMGEECWIGADVHVDLAADVVLGDRVSVGPGTLINTHLNVGTPRHRLHRWMPSSTAPVRVGDDSFIAVRSLLLAGTELGRETFVAAGSMVQPGTYPDGVLLAGAPAREVRRWE